VVVASVEPGSRRKSGGVMRGDVIRAVTELSKDVEGFVKKMSEESERRTFCSHPQARYNITYR
jgi:hypothetical protein